MVNDSIETAESIPMRQIYKGQYCYLIGHFVDADLEDDDTYVPHEDRKDFYSFTLYPSDGYDGRIAIRLAAVSEGDDYEMILRDEKGKAIDSTKNHSQVIKLVKTPSISTATKYYIEVIAHHIGESSLRDYHIAAVDYIARGKTTLRLSPSKLTASPGVWSSDAYKTVSLPAGSKVVSAKISATKGNAKKDYGHTLRVRINNGAYTTVKWKSGDINLPELVGKDASGTWYAGFMAAELPSSATGIVSMSSFNIVLEYEYESR